MAHFTYLSQKAYLRMIIKLKNWPQVFFCESFSNADFIFFSIANYLANYTGWAITCWPFGGEDLTPQNVRAKTWIS
jgi:hypothetical protein